MLTLLLPLLGVTALQMQSQTDVEDALTDGVRDALADGWTLADVRGNYEEVIVTMTRSGKVEQHVAHLDGTSSAYRIDVGGTVPSHPYAPEYVAQAIGNGGGLEIAGSCGMLDIRTYERGPRAKGAAAARLVGVMLKAADDLEHADVEDDRAVFGLALQGSYAELHVALDDGRVVRAELRKYGHGPDRTTHTKQRAMKRALGKRVTHIEDDGAGLVLVGAKRFAIGADAFEDNYPDDEHEGCGC